MLIQVLFDCLNCHFALATKLACLFIDIILQPFFTLIGQVYSKSSHIPYIELYNNHGQEPEEMPDFYRLTGDMVLVRCNKGDAYYVTTLKTCSCPAAIFHRGPCKHQRTYFPESKTIRPMSMAGTLEQADKNLPRMPYQYQRMVRAAREEAEAEPLELGGDHKPFKPFIEDGPKKAAGVYATDTLQWDHDFAAVEILYREVDTPLPLSCTSSITQRQSLLSSPKWTGHL